MTPRQEEVDALARAVDRVVFHQAGAIPDVQASSLALISYLNDSFPQVSVAAARRERLQRRMLRALRVPSAEPAWNLARLEAEMNRRLQGVDPRWRPLVGGAALVLLGAVGVAVWRQRSAIKPAMVAPR